MGLLFDDFDVTIQVEELYGDIPLYLDEELLNETESLPIHIPKHLPPLVEISSMEDTSLLWDAEVSP